MRSKNIDRWGGHPKHHKHEWAMDVPKGFGIDGFENCLGFVWHTHPTKQSGGVSICPYMSADVGVANHLKFSLNPIAIR